MQPNTMTYTEFLARKAQLDGDHGFAPTIMPDTLFPHQAALVDWAVRKGRGAILADCGLGKSLMEMVWAQNVNQHTGKLVLILTPLAVADQFVTEAQRFSRIIAATDPATAPTSEGER